MKTVFITGATSGIGWSTALKFNKQGYRLILCGRRQERLEALQKNLDIPCFLFNEDITHYEKLPQILKTLPEDFRQIDILINNAGLAFGMETADKASLKDWEIMVNTNIKGLMGYTHGILPQMVARNAGHIINLGSIAATNPYLGGNVYGATKAFVHQFSKNLRNDLLGNNIKVTIIAPGLVETEFFVRRFKEDEEKAEAVFNGIQALKADDIAESILWSTQQPSHVNINLIEVMPLCQAPGNITPYRKP